MKWAGVPLVPPGVVVAGNKAATSVDWSFRSMVDKVK